MESQMAVALPDQEAQTGLVGRPRSRADRAPGDHVPDVVHRCPSDRPRRSGAVPRRPEPVRPRTAAAQPSRAHRGSRRGGLRPPGQDRDGRGRGHPPRGGPARRHGPARLRAAYAAIGAPAPAPPTRRQAARRTRAPVPQLHVRRVRPRPVEPVRARGRDGGRRGAAVDGVQPAVHLRRRRASARPTCSSRSGITSGD